MKSQERIKSEFKGMSAPQLVILSGILLNTLLAVVLLAQLSGLSALKTSLDSSFASIEQRINATLTTTQVEIQSSVSSAVEQINSSGTALSCSGSYTGSINFPSSPYSYFLSGSVNSFGSMSGALRSNSPSLPSLGNDSTGSITLNCR